MSRNYSITIQNSSQSASDFCVYQWCAEEKSAKTLAWLCKKVHPGARVCFEWDDTYCFFWSEQGTLTSKIDAGFSSRETRDADPRDAGKNFIQLSYDGAYKFVETQRAGEMGSLHLYADWTVPSGKASVGIGMSDLPICSVFAAPNMEYTFRIPNKYAVSFGTVRQGDYIDGATKGRAKDFTFPPGVDALSVILRQDNTWSDILY